jgi:hypothetical protein
LKEEAFEHTMDNLFWKRLWTCHKTDNGHIHFTELNRDATGLKAHSYILLKKRKNSD